MRLPLRFQSLVTHVSFGLVLFFQLFAEPEVFRQPAQAIDGSPHQPQIDRLIRQLGSDQFLERQSADSALNAIGPPALDALRHASTRHKDLEIRTRARRLVATIENRLDSLLVDYRAYCLPLPPAGAELIRFNRCEGETCNGKPIFHYTLGFLLPSVADRPSGIMLIVGKVDLVPRVAGQPYRYILQQTSTEILGSNTGVVFVRPDQMKCVDVADLRCYGLDSNGALVTAIQCESLGWHNLAQALLEYSLANAKNPVVTRKALAELAWEELDHKLIDKDTDWTKAAAGMRMVLAVDPTLDSDDRRGLLRSMEAALVPSKAQPGSIEAMVDDLMEARSGLEDLMDLLQSRPDRSYLRVLCQGMAAVPTLLQHLDDDRLTRRNCLRPTRWQFHHDRVRDIVSDLLRDLADGELGRGTYWGCNVIRSEALDKDTAQAWWDKVRHLGEEEYLLAHALPVDAKWPNQSILRVLAAKYPRHLLKVYRTLLDERSEVYSWPLAELVVETSLPEKDRLAILRYAAEHPNVEHRRAALKGLEKLTQKK